MRHGMRAAQTRAVLDGVGYEQAHACRERVEQSAQPEGDKNQERSTQERDR